MCVLTYHAQTVSTRPLLGGKGGELGMRLMCVLTHQGSSVIRINSLEVLQQRSNSFIIVDNCQVMESFLQSAQEGRQHMMYGCTNQIFEKDNTPQVLQTLWLEICCTQETPSCPPRFQEHRHSPDKDVKHSVIQSIDRSISQPIMWATVLHVPSSPRLVWTAPGPVHQ